MQSWLKSLMGSGDLTELPEELAKLLAQAKRDRKALRELLKRAETTSKEIGGLTDPLEALKIIAIYRLILPKSEIRVCGGRSLTLRDLNSFIFNAGADGLLLGNYLTTTGRRPEEDLQMIKDMGLII